MIENLKFKKILFASISIFALISSMMGVFNLEIYYPVVTERIIPGLYTQDLLVLISSFFLFFLSFSLKKNNFKKLIIIHGILGFFLYAYGIYAIEQVYTSLYPIYLLLLSLCFFSLIYSLSTLKKEEVDNIEEPFAIIIVSSIFAIFIAIMFNFIWLSNLIPLIKNSNRIEYTFSIYIIDLVFIMPSLAISAIMALRRNSFGIINLISLFILSFGILFPLALGEILKPSVFGLEYNIGELSLFLVLSLLFLLFSIIGLVSIRPKKL